MFWKTKNWLTSFVSGVYAAVSNKSIIHTVNAIETNRKQAGIFAAVKFGHSKILKNTIWSLLEYIMSDKLDIYQGFV